eukprot:1944925-Rhodomonas_salina.3
MLLAFSPAMMLDWPDRNACRLWFVVRFWSLEQLWPSTADLHLAHSKASSSDSVFAGSGAILGGNADWCGCIAGLADGTAGDVWVASPYRLSNVHQTHQIAPASILQLPAVRCLVLIEEMLLPVRCYWQVHAC